MRLVHSHSQHITRRSASSLSPSNAGSQANLLQPGPSPRHSESELPVQRLSESTSTSPRHPTAPQPLPARQVHCSNGQAVLMSRQLVDEQLILSTVRVCYGRTTS